MTKNEKIFNVIEENPDYLVISPPKIFKGLT